MTDAAVSAAPQPDPDTERRDIVSVLGSSLLQPMADHIDRLLQHEARPSPSHGENGYAATLVVQFNMLLESYVSRLRYTRRAETNKNLNVADQLQAFFADLPRPDALAEVYLIGKATSHNHMPSDPKRKVVRGLAQMVMADFNYPQEIQLRLSFEGQLFAAEPPSP